MTLATLKKPKSYPYQFRGMHGEQSDDRGFSYADVMSRVGHANAKFPVGVVLASLMFLKADDSA